jgi:hypothetical protein
LLKCVRLFLIFENRLQFEMETGQLTEEELTAVKAEQSALLGYQKHAEKRKEDMKDPKKKAEWEVKKAQRRMTTAKTSEERAEAGAGTYKSDAVVVCNLSLK